MEKFALKSAGTKTGFPVIVGVSHAPEKTAQEMKRIKIILGYRRAHGAKTVGLELREDYERLGKEETVGGYFYDVADMAKKMGFTVVPLEKPSLCEEEWPVSIAKEYVKDGRFDVDAFITGEAECRNALANAEANLRDSKGADQFFSPPELREENCKKIVAYYKRWLGYYEKAKELLERTGGSGEEIIKEWTRVQELRNLGIIEAVRKNKTDITILGANHGRALTFATGIQYIELEKPD